jgi:hypothetical protein
MRAFKLNEENVAFSGWGDWVAAELSYHKCLFRGARTFTLLWKKGGINLVLKHPHDWSSIPILTYCLLQQLSPTFPRSRKERYEE